VNGREIDTPKVDRGYLTLQREWHAGDVVELHLAMPVQRVKADDRVAADRGRVALMRGPLVYCIESADNGGSVRNVYLPDDAAISTERRADLLGGITVLRASAKRLPPEAGDPVPAELMAIPYYANANRQNSEMLVWLPTDENGAMRQTIASLATPTASHCFANDTVSALNDGETPKNSSDEARHRFTWWDHRGTSEWVQYDFDQPRTVSSVSVYWWDDHRLGRHCAAPKSWRLMYRTQDGQWKPVKARGEFGTKLEMYNAVEFEPVQTTALRIEVELPKDLSSGILQWQVSGK
jgi:hypothetical protein